MLMSHGEDLSKVTVFIDGAARGNPGPGGIGIVIRDEKGRILKEHKEYLGNRVTNNQAEYKALIKALELCIELGCREVAIYSDSELLVKQLTGYYRVKNNFLKKLFRRVKSLERQFKRVEYNHIRREQNREADFLANMAIDELKK